MNFRRAVVAVREQRDALAIGRFANAGERNRSWRLSARKHQAVGKFDGIIVALQQRAGHFGQAAAEFRAGIGDGRAVQVGAGRCSGRGRVGNFVGTRGHDADRFEIAAPRLSAAIC